RCVDWSAAARERRPAGGRLRAEVERPGRAGLGPRVDRAIAGGDAGVGGAAALQIATVRLADDDAAVAGVTVPLGRVPDEDGQEVLQRLGVANWVVVRPDGGGVARQVQPGPPLGARSGHL